MCGISGAFGPAFDPAVVQAMIAAGQHRGPDSHGIYVDAEGRAALGHNRLSIIDLSDAGRQPMRDSSGNLWLVFNGEIYNHLELRQELHDYPYRSRTDSELILAAYRRWKEDCLDHLWGMFAFAIWDSQDRRLFAARDRFGVKPLHYCAHHNGGLWLASEIAALHAAGVPARPDPVTWATYLTYGLHDHSDRTFWENIASLPPGHWLTWCDGRLSTGCWYDLSRRVDPEFDMRPDDVVQEEYSQLLQDSIRMRFRSDVPVGINLSGGLDSSVLLGASRAYLGSDANTTAYTYITGAPEYDELPWVRQMLKHAPHKLQICPMRPQDVPELADSVQAHESEPFGGLPTLVYARLFEQARAEGTLVLLDGQGMDEQWAGYDYYERCASEAAVGRVQGSRQTSVRPDCLTPEFRSLAVSFEPPRPFPDMLRNRQYQDVRYTKIPRALRFNDRVSMRSSTELREPFMDHRLFELAFRQPPERKIQQQQRKWLLRRIARDLIPEGISEAPKRPVQTPQREWLIGPLREWCTDCMELALQEFNGEWLDGAAVVRAWEEYLAGQSDNSYYLWQWVSLGLTLKNSVRNSVAVCHV
jgi:asparagine synthase (glutamine-hydrolysing)